MTATALPPSGLPLAGLPRRLGALIYEALLLVAIVFVASFVALPLISPGHAGAAQSLSVPAAPERMALFCLLFCGMAWYFVWSWTAGRRTLPMKTWRLRLVAANGEPPTRKMAILRYLAAWIGPVTALALYAALHPYGLEGNALWLVALDYLWAFVDPQRQFLHDRIAGTRLVT